MVLLWLLVNKITRVLLTYSDRSLVNEVSYLVFLIAGITWHGLPSGCLVGDIKNNMKFTQTKA